MTTRHPAQESLGRLLAECACEVNVMTKTERFGLACGWLVRDGHTLGGDVYQLARDWSAYWEDHEVPGELITEQLRKQVIPVLEKQGGGEN